MIDSPKDGPAPGHLPQLQPRLWSEFGRRVAARSLAGLRVLALGLDAAALMLARTELRPHGVRAIPAAATVRPLIAGPAHCGDFDAVIVNFDGFADVDEGVEALLDFRRACPWVTVLLVSARVAADDPGAERRAICDATLRSPFTGPRLAAALRTAIENAAGAPRG